MNKEKALKALQVEALKESILKQEKVCNYQAFFFREQLTEAFKDNSKAKKQLQAILQKAEVDLNNILNFYPHESLKQ